MKLSEEITEAVLGDFDCPTEPDGEAMLSWAASAEELEKELADSQAALELATEEMVAEDNALFRVPRDTAWWLMCVKTDPGRMARKEGEDG